MTSTLAAVHESGFDAVDGSSTGTRVPKMWALFKAPTIWRSQVTAQPAAPLHRMNRRSLGRGLISA